MVTLLACLFSCFEGSYWLLILELPILLHSGKLSNIPFCKLRHLLLMPKVCTPEFVKVGWWCRGATSLASRIHLQEPKVLGGWGSSLNWKYERCYLIGRIWVNKSHANCIEMRKYPHAGHPNIIHCIHLLSPFIFHSYAEKFMLLNQGHNFLVSRVEWITTGRKEA